MIKSLEQIGLTKNEATVYKALIERGELTPSGIANATFLTRVNSYNVARLLITKGLVEQIPNKKVTTYRALSPEKLKDYFKKRKLDLEKEEKVFEIIYSEMINKYKLMRNPKGVSRFEGKKGIKYIFDSLFFKDRKIKEVLIISSPLDLVLGNYLVDHITKYAKKGIKSRVLSPKSRRLTNKIKNINLNRKIKYFDDNLFVFPSEICIVNNRVFITSYGKSKGVTVLENSNEVETFIKLFEFLWKRAKSYN